MIPVGGRTRLNQVGLVPQYKQVGKMKRNEPRFVLITRNTIPIRLYSPFHTLPRHMFTYTHRVKHIMLGECLLEIQVKTYIK